MWFQIPDCMFQRWGAHLRWCDSPEIRPASLRQEILDTSKLKRTPPPISAWRALHNNSEAPERKGGQKDRGGRQRGKMGWGPWCTVRAKKLPASQPLHVWPGTALRSVFWGLSKAHHSEEAISVGMLQGCQGPVGGETRDPAWQPGHNEQENTLVFPLMFQQQSTFVPLILIPQVTLQNFFSSL